MVVCGPPGVGKTRTGAALAQRLPAALLDLDSITNPLVDVIAAAMGVRGDYASPDLARLVREPRYACLTAAARDCLQAGLPVVMVAPFTRERTDPKAWQRLSASLRDANGEPCLVWLRADEQLVRSRMGHRDADRDQVMLAGERGIDVLPPVVPHLEVDATLTPESQAEELVKQFSMDLR